MANKIETNLRKLYREMLEEMQKEMNKAQKEGYVFDTNIIPKTPKRISQKSVDKLTRIKNDMYKHSTYYDAFGKSINGEVKRKLDNKVKSKKTSQNTYNKTDYKTQNVRTAREQKNTKIKNKLPANKSKKDVGYAPNVADLLIDNLYQIIENYDNEDMINYLKNTIQNVIDSVGKDVVANNLSEYREEVIETIQAIFHYYGKKTGSDNIYNLLNILARTIDLNVDTNVIDEWINVEEEWNDIEESEIPF